MHVIGTAGHVDHGKSTLVEALTGIDPDRLKEEKERAMTIDLGFAWLSQGEGQPEIGIVDVPGHRDFIENMLAGVGGIDLAILVIAADEGVMPQTKEHLAILDLLQVPGGIVALTKIDLVDDPDWQELVTLDILETLSGTVLADAPVIPVSAVSGQGLAELRATVIEKLQHTPERPDIGLPRLPIDRAFTLSGFGTIVTGTLLDGSFRVGDAVVIQPGGHKGRIRGLQTHGAQLELVRPGSRVAINLTGLTKDDLVRGAVVTVPGTPEATLLCDVSYRHLPDAQVPLKHNMEVKVFVGASETVARTRVLGQKTIAPGDTGWLQLAMRGPVPVSRGDRFILRRPSPPATIGGGTVLDPHPGKRHRRFRPDVIARLETLAKGSATELMLHTLARHEPLRRKELLSQAGLSAGDAEQAWQTLSADGLIRLVGGYTYTLSGWQRLKERATASLAAYHEAWPLRLGIGREELRSRLRCEQSIFNALLDELTAGDIIADQRGLLRLPDHVIRFTARQQAAVDGLLARLAKQGVNSSSVKDVRGQLGDDVYLALIDLSQLVQLNAEVVYSGPVYQDLVDQIKEYLDREGKINVAALRDMFNTSRKYAIALLEHLDDVHITRREGDDRVLVD
jgi:selenocysteine-specific elongation factor